VPICGGGLSFTTVTSRRSASRVSPGRPPKVTQNAGPWSSPVATLVSRFIDPSRAGPSPLMVGAPPLNSLQWSNCRITSPRRNVTSCAVTHQIWDSVSDVVSGKEYRRSRPDGRCIDPRRARSDSRRLERRVPMRRACVQPNARRPQRLRRPVRNPRRTGGSRRRLPAHARLLAL